MLYLLQVFTARDIEMAIQYLVLKDENWCFFGLFWSFFDQFGVINRFEIAKKSEKKGKYSYSGAQIFPS